MNPGIYSPEELSIEAYHQSAGISSSGLKEIARSPLHYWAKYLNPDQEPTEVSAARLVGQAFHCLLGEPEKFDKQFCRQPDGIDRRTKDGKQAWEEFLVANPDKSILNKDQWDQIHRMRDAAMKNPTVKVLLSKGRYEHSFYWKHPTLDVLCKCRPDFITDQGIIIDFKTAEDASAEGFQRSAWNYGYHRQAALCLEGVQAHIPGAGPFLNLAIEKEPPYAVAVYEQDQETLAPGSIEVLRLLTIYAECLRTNSWPGYQPFIVPLGAPAWARKGISL